MKYIKEYLETVVKIKPLGELTTKEDELNGLSGEMVYIDGKCSDIFISHADYANWLESKYEQKKCCGEVNDIAMQQQLQIWFDKGKCSGRDEVIFHPEIYGLQKQGEHKPADKVKPKFRVGDWVVYNRDDYSREVIQVYDIRDGRYYFNDNVHFSWSIKECDEKSHLWSIEDAKDGDILVSQYNQPFIYNGSYNEYKVGAHCGIECTGEQFVDTYAKICWTDNKFINPATKEQRDTLMKVMADAGYTFDFEKKELKKIEQKPTECIKFSNVFENQVSNLLMSVLNREHEYNEGFVKYVAQSLLGYAKNELKPIEWSEEDEKMFNSALWHIKNSCSNGGKNSGEFEVYNWLKTIKDKVQSKSIEWSEKE